jgi:tetratricopeptide (TPR) repeat protein
MTDFSPVRDIERTVTLHRRRGDAQARRGRSDEAKEAYETAFLLTDRALGLLSKSPAADLNGLLSLDRDAAAEAAELLGVRGGLLRRLDRVADALESYRLGAVLEANQNLAGTYNRANAIKLALITGDRTVAQLHAELAALHDALDLRLKTDERAADDAWLWADLGDVRLLLGDDDGAQSAYRTFAAKASTESPVSTLAVLEEVVHALDAHADPDAARTAASLRKVEAMIEEVP